MSLGSVGIVGESHSALIAAAHFLRAGKSVTWIRDGAVRMRFPLNGLRDESCAEMWKKALSDFEVDAGNVQGSLVREFRSKAFRVPEWLENGETEPALWAAEKHLAECGSELRVKLGESLSTQENLFRESVEKHPHLKISSGVHLTEVDVGDPHCQWILSSGETGSFEEIVYADRWDLISQIKGVPKESKLTHLRAKLHPVGMLQLTLRHKQAAPAELSENLCTVLAKDPGDAAERRLWGYFDEGGSLSVWSVLLSREESEDNHGITKKLRKMKQTLNKTFLQTTWLPEGKEFLESVEGEQVRFEEAAFFNTSHVIHQPITVEIAGKRRMSFFTDGFGFSAALKALQTL